MSREPTFAGERLSQGPPALWTYTPKIVTIPAPAFTVVGLYPVPGPLEVEWFQIEADSNNDTFVVIGMKNVQINTASPASALGITTLGPGEGCVFEPNDKGQVTDGILTASDGDVAFMNLVQDLDVVDVTLFYAISGGGTANGVTLKCTIGNRQKPR